ncbi:YihY/virulence factor BrkB family protein [Legionella cardiaca]|uniref:YihY/virulence factor BrkB family protein n=1 Tax=Legionella cardiaca TaxID=1071983 RepID=A0ABY8ANV8_9GAMM|nr:YihY/virulence factor BrkB family protein [Legionella cardiaca]WED42379.1 YihY/virulence factor BrkB family protein [Legionella cardiaca]
MRVKIILKKLLENWSQDKVATLSAALSYYTIFSISPLLIISIAIAGLVFDPNLVQENLLEQIGKTFGNDPAEQIKILISSARPATNILAKIVSIIVLLFGASGFFGALQTGLNAIWGVFPDPNMGFWELIKSRFLSFTLVLGVGFLLLVSLIISLILSLVTMHLLRFFPQLIIFSYGLNLLISIAAITLLFAMIFKIIPDVSLQWRDVWLGAFFTALLFTIGKFLLGLYLSHSNLAQGFGPSAALIIILVWIYYSAQILFTGAEFTKVYYLQKRKKIRPSKNAKLIG